MRKILFAAILLSLLSASTFAHEYWFEPDKFMLSANEKTAVHLFVGDGLIKDKQERPFQLDKTPMFQLFYGNQILDLKPSLKDEAMPFYNFSAEKSGNYLLAMERNWSYIKIETAKFENYLREDGMEYIIAEREKLGERNKEGRERYSRYLKSLLQVGDKRDDVYKRKLGQKLEIMPLQNPYSKKVGDSLKFQVLFNGKPLVNRTVFADNRSSKTQKFTTDKNGEITMKIDSQGLWLVRLVVMQRCTKDCGEADWESFWGAISFGV